MPKFVDKSIKNVHSLRKQVGKTSGMLRTPFILYRQFTTTRVHNRPIFTPFRHVFNTGFYTPENWQFNLLYRHLYPQSTPPINMKKKENLERNT